jgi:hypothetical protein
MEASGYEGRIGRYGGAPADAPIRVAGVSRDAEVLDVHPDGSPGRFFVTLDAKQQDAVRRGTSERLDHPAGAFRLSARAWYVLGFA